MFALPALPYAQNALEPFMSAETLAVHHGKHHAAYIEKTNALLAERGARPRSMEEAVRVSEDDHALFNQAAQAWNHGFFWHCMTPDRREPKGVLLAAIESAFGGVAELRREFIARGVAQFASGWIWLVSNPAGALSLHATANAGTPIVRAGVTPILTCDLWEHAYFAARQYEARGDASALWSFPAPRA